MMTWEGGGYCCVTEETQEVQVKESAAGDILNNGTVAGFARLLQNNKGGA